MKVIILLFLCSLTVLTSCSRFLEAVPDRSLALLTSVEQYEQMLNTDDLYLNMPAIPDFSADDYYVETETWQSMPIRSRNSYAWSSDIYEGSSASGITQDWSIPYQLIYKVNVVITGLEESSWDRDAHFNEILAQALFVRAFQHYVLQETYGQPFNPASADSDLGIPLRLNSDLEAPIERATVRQTFDQIITDLLKSFDLFDVPYRNDNTYWGSKAAVSAMLSRVYLTMQDYENALKYADISLSFKNTLLDYKSLYPGFVMSSVSHPEILNTAWIIGNSGIFVSSRTYVDTTLYEMYDEQDLRKQVFFREVNDRIIFNRFYSGNGNPFAGLAIDEVYLNRAECRARTGNLSGALDDLNTLRRNRFTLEGFVELNLANTPDALVAVLDERRRELVLRGTRWTDLRRLNQDDRFEKALLRQLDREYTLPPNDPRYAIQIPPYEVVQTKIPQNER